jgi:hypothetical protein
MLVRRKASQAHDHRSEMMPRKETVGTPEKLGSPGVLFVVQAVDQGNADAQRSLTVAAPRGNRILVRPPPRLHHRGRRSRTARLPDKQREWVRPTAPPSEHSTRLKRQV